MIKQMTMHLTRNNDNDGIQVMAKVELNHLHQEQTFELNNNFLIKELKINDETIDYEITKAVEIPFRTLCQRIHFKTDYDFNAFTVSYQGPVDGWYNEISDNYIGLNIYSAWYPMINAFEVYDKTVYLHNFQEYEVIKAVEEDHLVYRSLDFDANIIAIKNWFTKKFEYTGSNFNLYINPTEGNEEELSEQIKTTYENVLQYLKDQLGLPFEQSLNFDLVICNNPLHDGGYFRKNLIVLIKASSDPISFSRFLAHELGHNWATGADVMSFEDWLNESIAEAIAVSYLKFTYGQETYEKYMKKVEKYALESPAIRTPDNSRPEGVHFKGVYLFHLASKEFGEDIIVAFIKIFVDLKEKNTANFLTAICSKLGKEVHDFISVGLTN
ncbi:MAG: hypothetical protein JXR88_04565 [Clostridia bacterium]|nr:hypothetical protein [Clostridia bacterium]